MLYEFYQLLLTTGKVNRAIATMIDDLSDGALSEILPISSYTEVYSDVNLIDTLEFLRRYLEIGKVFIIEPDAISDKFQSYKQVWENVDLSVVDYARVCARPENICINVSIMDSRLDNALDLLKDEYNTALAMVNYTGEIPRFYLTDVSEVYTINGIIDFCKSGVYTAIYDAVINEAVKIEGEDSYELDTSKDRRFYHFIKMINSRYTELFFKLVSEIS